MLASTVGLVLRLAVLPAALCAPLAGAARATEAPPASAPAPQASAGGAPQAAPPASKKEALDKARLERMLRDGDTAMIVQTFRRHPGEVLPFVDSYLEGGLAEIEKADAASAEAAEESALESFRTAVKFAGLADQAFGEAIFTEYAAAFASWGPEERQRFREGQRLYREGRRKAAESPAEALILFRRSLANAEPLGDFWGIAMAQQGIADALQKQGQLQEAHDAVLRAMELYGRLQLRPSYVKSLTTCAGLRQALGLPDAGVGQYRMALQSLPATASSQERQQIAEALIAALERIGRKDEADKVRAAEAARAEASPAP